MSKKVNISYCVSIQSINIGLLGVSMAVILGAIIIRKCNINTIRSIFLWIRVRLVKSIRQRIILKSLKKFYPRTILWGAAGLLEVYKKIGRGVKWRDFSLTTNAAFAVELESPLCFFFFLRVQLYLYCINLPYYRVAATSYTAVLLSQNTCM